MPFMQNHRNNYRRKHKTMLDLYKTKMCPFFKEVREANLISRGDVSRVISVRLLMEKKSSEPNLTFRRPNCVRIMSRVSVYTP